MKIQHETFFYNTPYEQDCLNCINRAYLIHVARLTYGFARLGDDRARSQVKIIPYAQPRAMRKCAYAQSIATTVL